MRTAKDERVRGTAAQALLDKGWGKPKVEVVTEEKQDYIAALQAVNERLRQSWEQGKFLALHPRHISKGG